MKRSEMFAAGLNAMLKVLRRPLTVGEAAVAAGCSKTMAYTRIRVLFARGQLTETVSRPVPGRRGPRAVRYQAVRS